MNADAELLAMAPRLEAALAADKAARAAGAAFPTAEAGADFIAASYALDAVIEATAGMAVTTFAGLRVKARAAEIVAAMMCDIEDEMDMDVRIMRRLVADVLSLPAADVGVAP